MTWTHSCPGYDSYDVAVSTTLVYTDLALFDLLPGAAWLLRSLLYCLLFVGGCERKLARWRFLIGLHAFSYPYSG